MKRTPLLLLTPAALIALWVGVFLDHERGPDGPLAPLDTPPTTPGTEPEVSRGPGAEVTESPERIRAPAATREQVSAPPRPARTVEVKGTVQGRDGRLIPGGAVRFRLGQRGIPMTSLGTVPAPSGAFAATLELPDDPAVNDSARTRLEASASAPGHRWAPPRSCDLLTAEEPLTFELVLRRGATVRGRVLDAKGRPFRGATVTSDPLHGGRSHHGWSEADGSFVLGVTESGPHELRAVDRGVGRSAPLHLELDPSGDNRAPDLQLRRGSTLAGTTRYPDGQIAARVPLAAFPEREVDCSSLGQLVRAVHTMDDPAGWHLACATVTSDEAGCFRFQGLEPGRYFIVVRKGPSGEPSSTRELFDTGEEEAEVLVDGYRVRLRVVDALGRPIRGTSFSYSIGTENELTASSGQISWPEGTAYLYGYRLLRPGSTASVTVWVPSWPKAVVEREIVEGVFETRLVVQLAPSAEHATLKLELVASDGALLERCQVQLFEQGEVREHHTFTCRGGPVPPLRLAPGRYRLVISPREQAMHYLQGVEELQLEGGETHELRVELVATGSLLVRVHRPAGRDRLRLKALRLLELPGPGAAPGVEATSAISSKLSWHLIDHCRDHSGETAPYTLPSFDLLDAGPHRLELEFHDCAPVERHVEIVGGRTEELEIWLEEL